MGHKHWPMSHPLYKFAAVHDMPKADCDALWREYMHGHEGVRCDMQIVESKSKRGKMNQMPTCQTPNALEVKGDEKREVISRAFDRFIATEEARMAAGGSPV